MHIVQISEFKMSIINEVVHRVQISEGDVGLDYESLVVQNPLLSNLQDLSDDEEEEEEEDEIDGGNKKRHRNISTSDETCVDEYFEVQSSIGLDCTLDFEVSDLNCSDFNFYFSSNCIFYCFKFLRSSKGSCRWKLENGQQNELTKIKRL